MSKYTTGEIAKLCGVTVRTDGGTGDLSRSWQKQAGIHQTIWGTTKADIGNG